MKSLTHNDVKDKHLHKKLEGISTRKWWSNGKFNDEEFFIYCAAVVHEADLLRHGFIGSNKYQRLAKMSDEGLRQYLKNSKRIKNVPLEY